MNATDTYPDRIAKLETRIGELESEARQRGRDLARADEAASAFVAGMTARDERIAELERTLELAQAQIASLETVAASELDSRSRLVGSHARLRADLGRAEAERDEARDERDAARSRAAQIEASLAATLEERAEHEARIAELEAGLRASAEAFVGMIENRNRRIAELEDELGLAGEAQDERRAR